MAFSETMLLIGTEIGAYYVLSKHYCFYLRAGSMCGFHAWLTPLLVPVWFQPMGLNEEAILDLLKGESTVFDYQPNSLITKSCYILVLLNWLIDSPRLFWGRPILLGLKGLVLMVFDRLLSINDRLLSINDNELSNCVKWCLTVTNKKTLKSLKDKTAIWLSMTIFYGHRVSIVL